MHFVDPRKVPFVTPRSRGELPHLEKSGCTYFVTFRLFDAVVSTKGRSRETVEQTDGIFSPEELMSAYDPPLTLGSCLLKDPDTAGVVASAIRHFDGTRYSLLAACVMPNHVHAVLTPYREYLLEKILHSWKSFSAHEINKIRGRNGVIWERESFDHTVRSTESLERIIRYVAANPVKAGLSASPEDWPFSYVKSAGFARTAAGTAAPQ